MAGGISQWNVQSERLEPGIDSQGIALTGNAAGYIGHPACLESGRTTIDQLLG
ncbi:MAG: hypothetical protein MO846_01250 [Candidatus Devosia symbiotica]|nr:hypothetical protein [Candidatus Devosia symbiotica]